MIDHDNLEEFRDPQTYDLQDEGYEEDYPLTEQWARATGGPLLDLACGTGRMALRMAELGYQVTGVDITPEMIARARQKAAKQAVSIDWVGNASSIRVSTRRNALARGESRRKSDCAGVCRSLARRRKSTCGTGMPVFMNEKTGWMALTYYLWERVVQELIEDARDVCFRDDWAEETRADAARLFHELLTEGSDIDAASAAAAHLPRNLTIHTRDIP